MKNGQWQNSRNGGRFVFPIKALSKVFRAKYYAKIKSKLPIQYEQIRQELWQKPGVVFAEKPFESPMSVVEYLGRYTHKIAISTARIKSIDNQNVTFDDKDYRVAGAKKANDTCAPGVYQAVFTTYFAQTLGQDPSLRFFEQYLKTSKVASFTSKTASKGIRKSRKEAFYAQMTVL